LNDIKDAYGAATGLDYDATRISRNMTGYFAFNWSRFQHAVSAEIKTGKHLLQRVAGDMTSELAVAVGAGLRQNRARAFMDTNCNTQI